MLERIKKLCKIKGISMAKLERDIGLGDRTLLNWKDHAPSIEKVKAIADYFSVSIDYLVGRNNNDSSIFGNNPILSSLLALMNDMNEEGQEDVLKYAKYLDSTGEYKKHNQLEMAKKEA